MSRRASEKKVIEVKRILKIHSVGFGNKVELFGGKTIEFTARFDAESQDPESLEMLFEWMDTGYSGDFIIEETFLIPKKPRTA